MVQFGDFEPLCTHTPSYPWCNLFYHHILNRNRDVLTGLSENPASAPVGINPRCGISLVGTTIDGTKSLSNIANIVVCALSMVFVTVLIYLTSRRKAAVGRVELRALLILYLITLPLSLITTGAFLQQGSTPLTIITAIHAGAVAALFAALLANALVATQVVEDGTLSSVVPFSILCIIAFGVATYISLDVAFQFTEIIGGASNPVLALKNIPLFIMTSIWPAACVLIYLCLMSYIVLAVLSETRPMWFYLLSAILFVLGQLAWFLLGGVICRGSSSRVDGSFVATLLETAASGVLYLAWKSITEESWEEEDPYYPS